MRLKPLLRCEGILHVIFHVMAFVYIGVDTYCLCVRAWWLFLVSSAAGLAITYLMHGQQQRIMQIVQRIFNLRASIIVKRVMAGTPVTYSIFLRPFSADGGLIDGIGKWSTDPLKQLEPKIALSMEPLAPLIAVFPQPPRSSPSIFELWTADREWKNGRSACFGGGRFQIANGEWQRVVKKLMLRAAAIFVVPGHGDGSMWEISLLQSASMLPKAIWVMPPRASGGLTEVDWNEIIGRCRETGLEMPTRKKLGRFFTLTIDGNLKSLEFYDVNGRRALRGVILRLLLGNLANPEFLETSSAVSVAGGWRRR